VIQVEIVDESGPVVRLRVARKLPVLSAYYTTAYWLDGLLIDTGCAHTSGQLTSALRDMPVEQVVNTHCHEDHIGANAEVQELCRCPILAHPDALPILQNPRLQPLQLYRRLFWGWPRPSQGKPIGDWVETERFRFQIVRTPGHSPDHICLFEPERGWLFSGDAYIGGKDRALRKGYDIHGIIDSLKRLAELPVSTTFSGSGSVRHNGAQALQDKIAYLEGLGERICALHNQGLSPRRIRRQVFGTELPISYLTLGHFSGMRLVRSYLGGSPQREVVAGSGDEEDVPGMHPEASSDNTGN
jgi:glyoxylase-like metal-dependent hydrolase (beta-lactamase superfamily II)